MKLFTKLSIIVAVAIMAIFTTASAGVPLEWSYRGSLTYNDSTAEDGIYSVEFSIYRDTCPDSTIPIWVERHDVYVKNGNFTVQLGSNGSPLSDSLVNGKKLWMGIRVENDLEMTPRIPIASVPFAFCTNTIDGASGGQIDGALNVDGIVQTSVGFQFPDGTIQTTAYDTIFPDAGGSVDGMTGGTIYGSVIIADSSGAKSGVENVELIPNRDGCRGGAINIKQLNGFNGVAIRAQDGSVNGAEILMYSGNGAPTLELDAEGGTGSGAFMNMFTPDNVRRVSLYANADQGGVMRLFQDNTNTGIRMYGGYNGKGGEIRVFNTEAGGGVAIYGNYDGGAGRIVTPVLQITGGSDLSEQFEIRPAVAKSHTKAGMVVSIDPDNPGQLVVSSKAYDPTVAGIISGAGNVAPGMLMGHRGTMADGQYPVALTGRVFCYVDASYGSIKPGDLLTTSNTPGCAMKVTDRALAGGTIIGKAMQSLDDGTGLVLVLVNLQ